MDLSDSNSEEILSRFTGSQYHLYLSYIPLSEADLTLISTQIKERDWKVKEINFTGCSLTSLPISTWISEGLMSKVKKLDLSENLLTELPDLTGLNALESLEVYGNRLKKFPNLLKIKRLQNLDLSDNLIRKVPRMIHGDNLVNIDLSYNMLETFDVENLKVLKYLNLSFNRFSIAPDLKYCPRLKMVDLSYNQLKIDPRTYAYMYCQLETLKLEGNRIPTHYFDNFTCIAMSSVLLNIIFISIFSFYNVPILIKMIF